MSIEYSLSSSQPLTVYVVPSSYDYQLMLEGYSFRHYPECQKENVLVTSDSCEFLQSFGGLIFGNYNWRDAVINFNIKFYFHLSSYELLKDVVIYYYQVDNQECVVLDPTAGEYGHPGYGANLIGEKIAIDPLTKKYYYLK